MPSGEASRKKKNQMIGRPDHASVTPHFRYALYPGRPYQHIMITVLSGGTGTPKLLWGMRELLEDTELAVVVNTAEDIWMSGNHLSPDIDTVIYLCAGMIDTATWWGIRGDTFFTHETLHRRGHEEFLAIGDQDRATHIMRGELLRKGERLTSCTAQICRKFRVTMPILPMTDVPVASMVTRACSPHPCTYLLNRTMPAASYG